LLLGVAGAFAPSAAQAKPADPAAALAGVWRPERSPERLVTSKGQMPPLTPQARELYDQRIAMARKGDRSFDRTTWCAAPGVPRIMTMPYPFEIKPDRGLLAFIYGWYRWHRVVDMSGTPADAVLPLNMGYPVGRWDGRTLVIDTIGLADETTLDAAGLPHSEAMTLTERLRLLPDGRLEDRFTITDPANYTKPWEAVMTYRRVPGGTVDDDICPDRIRYGQPAVRPVQP